MTDCLISAVNGWDWIPPDSPEAGDIPDWRIVSGDLASDNQLLSAVIIQLFTDKRAPDDMLLPDGLHRPKGWWGDFYLDFEIGSLIWTIYRDSIRTDETLRKIERFARDAINEIIKQGAAARSEIEVTQTGDIVNINIALYGQDGSRTFRQEFQRFWEQ